MSTVGFLLGLAGLVAFFFVGVALDKHMERERARHEEWARKKREIGALDKK